MVLVAIAMVAIIAMAALSIDVITLYLAREEAQRSADAAALAAAQVISLSGITGTANPTTDNSYWQLICGGLSSAGCAGGGAAECCWGCGRSRFFHHRHVLSRKRRRDYSKHRLLILTGPLRRQPHGHRPNSADWLTDFLLAYLGKHRKHGQCNRYRRSIQSLKLGQRWQSN
jgi:type II secretory pathway pseudopilin PulG